MYAGAGMTDKGGKVQWRMSMTSDSVGRMSTSGTGERRL